MLACKQIDRLFQLLCLLPLLLSSHTVWAQAPFISYNATFPIGQSGLVTWDLNSFAGPVNLWVQELYPNASVPQVPLDCEYTRLGDESGTDSIQTRIQKATFYGKLALTSYRASTSIWYRWWAGKGSPSSQIPSTWSVQIAQCLPRPPLRLPALRRL